MGTMDKVLLVARYTSFGLFIICNAIICSVAVWNLSLAQPLGWNLPIDLYLIFLGAFGLGFGFVLMFIQLIVSNGFTSKMWFECIWVGVLCIMNLAGAAASLAILPDVMCQPDGIPIVRNRNPFLPFVGRQQVPDSCTSTRVLIAFTWISSITLLAYFFLLTTLGFLQMKRDPKIWSRNVRSVQYSDVRSPLPSAPPSPSAPRFKIPHKSTMASKIAAPRPRHAIHPKLYAYRSGLGTEYEIEHYRPVASPIPRQAEPVSSELAVPPVAAPPILERNLSIQGAAGTSSSPFYPQYMHSALSANPSHPVVTQPPFSISQQVPSSSPLPLGDWPRPDAIMQPLRTKRRRPPPLLEQKAGASSSLTIQASSSSDPAVPAPVLPGSRTRLSGRMGPRARNDGTSNVPNPPTPLDLVQ